MLGTRLMFLHIIDPQYLTNTTHSMPLQMFPPFLVLEEMLYNLFRHLSFFSKLSHCSTVCSFSISLVQTIGTKPCCVNQWSERMPLYCNCPLAYSSRAKLFPNNLIHSNVNFWPGHLCIIYEIVIKLLFNNF